MSVNFTQLSKQGFGFAVFPEIRIYDNPGGTTIQHLIFGDYCKDAEAIAECYPCFHSHLRRITEIQSMQLELHYLLRLNLLETGWPSCRSSVGGC